MHQISTLNVYRIQDGNFMHINEDLKYEWDKEGKLRIKSLIKSNDLKNLYGHNMKKSYFKNLYQF